MDDGLLGRTDLTGIPESGNVIVALSGGADSVALAHFLTGRLPVQRLLCAHVNHMLRGQEADADQAFVEDFCRSHGLRLSLLREDVAALAKKEKKGTEECGRLVRYRFFDSLLAGKADVIVTAHNANDNAETVLMNLAAGSGLTGLGGIPYRRGSILRPLLQVTREEIEQYCRANQLAYVTDSTNAGDVYLRNRIRHHVIPQLTETNPQFIGAVTRLTAAVREAQDYLITGAEDMLRQAKTAYGLSLKALKHAHPAVRKQALKRWLETEGCGRLSAYHLEKIADHLINGNCVSLPGGLQARCSADMLMLTREGNSPDAWEYSVGPGERMLPVGKILKILKKNQADTQNVRKINKLLFNSMLDCDTMTEALTVRNRRPGDRFTPAGRGVTKTLKKLFLEMKIPAAKRDDVVILQSGGEIVYVEGAGVSEGAKVTEHTKSALQITIEFAETRG